MRNRDYLALLISGWLILTVVSLFQHSPGYMDADYYYASAFQLVKRGNLYLPFLWNYLGSPLVLPQPAFLYWMPLSSLAAALGLLLYPQAGFDASQIVFIFIGGCIPPLTAYIGFQWSQHRPTALLAGSLALLPVFYLPVLPTSDSFGICMLGGIVWVVIAQYGMSIKQNQLDRKIILVGFGLGLIAGFMHLARADGWIWLILGVVAILWEVRAIWLNNRRSIGGIMLALLCLLAGYFLVIGPWFWRNLELFGGLFPPGGMRNLWQIDYNDLYRYPPEILSANRWLETGLMQIVTERLRALALNIQTFLAVQSAIFLAPLVIWGGWHLSSKKIIRILGLGYLATLGIMTFVFPFAGIRGGFFHSGSAFQPLFWVLGAVGLERFIRWGVRHRGWNGRLAGRIFRYASLVLVFGLTTFVFITRVIGTDWRSPVWDQSYRVYREVETWLQAEGAQPEDIVMVNNPPGYYLANQRSAIVIPEGDLETVIAVAERFQARYLILEPNHPDGLVAVYEKPDLQTGMEYIGSYLGCHFFRLSGYD